MNAAEMAAWLATEVMGWTTHDNAFVWHAAGQAVRMKVGYDGRECGLSVGTWSPMTDANDALAVLEAWCAAADMRSASINYLLDDTGYEVELRARGDKVWYGEAKSLPAAICQAVKAAVEGERGDG